MRKYKYHIDLYEKIYKDLSNNDRLKLNNKDIIVRNKAQIVKLFNLNSNNLEEIGEDGYFYHPCPIAQGALGYFDLFVSTKEEKYKELFMNQINWLELNGELFNNSLVYPFPFNIPSFSKHKKWVSGMYQGQILSSFVRAYIITKKKKYIEFADKVFKSFSFNLGEKYGFMIKDKFGIWYEEAPIIPAKHILNGYIFAIWGIYDYYQLTNRHELKLIWDSCINTLKNTINLYNLGYWSLYDLAGNIASYKYHNTVHIPQLKALYKMTKETDFKDMALKWENYNNSKLCRVKKKILNVKILVFGEKSRI